MESICVDTPARGTPRPAGADRGAALPAPLPGARLRGKIDQPERATRIPLTPLLLTVLLLACSGTEPAEPVISLAEGRWIGAITGDAQEGTLEWILRDTEGDVQGEGSLSTATASVPLTMDGTYLPPNLSLTIHPEGFEDISFSGTVSERTIKGRMSGAGLINRTVTLDRQP